MFEDDEDEDLGFSEAEIWYDNNLRYFDWKDKPPGLPIEVELFYYSVYVPFKKELKEPLRKMVNRHYQFIATETRPEILAKIESKINWVGHEFIMYLHGMFQFWKTGKDLREMFPELDKWAIDYPSYRRPNYLDASFWDQFDWLTEEQKQTFIEENRKEADEEFAFKEKPRSEFYDLLQRLTFKYYPGVQDLDTDGWVMFEAFMFDEYTNYQLDFEHYDGFIKYGFGVEDLDLPYQEYSAKYTERWKERREAEQRKKEEENKDAEDGL